MDEQRLGDQRKGAICFEVGLQVSAGLPGSVAEDSLYEGLSLSFGDRVDEQFESEIVEAVNICGRVERMAESPNCLVRCLRSR